MIGLEQIAEQVADEGARGKADAVDAEESVLERLDQNERQFGIERGKRLTEQQRRHDVPAVKLGVGAGGRAGCHFVGSFERRAREWPVRSVSARISGSSDLR